jgi:hypothetical protein
LLAHGPLALEMRHHKTDLHLEAVMTLPRSDLSIEMAAAFATQGAANVNTNLNGISGTTLPGGRVMGAGMIRIAAVHAASMAAQTVANAVAVKLSPRERLAALHLRIEREVETEDIEGMSRRARKAHAALYRSPRDLNYLGAGMFCAAPDVRFVYERVRKDIALTASGGLMNSVPDGTVVLHRSGPLGAAPPPPLIATRGTTTDASLKVADLNAKIRGLAAKQSKIGLSKKKITKSTEAVPRETDRLADLLQGLSEQ